MIIGAPPFQVGQQLWSLLGRGPGATRQRCHPMTDAQIHSLDKSGVQPSREAHPLQGEREICLCPKPHHVRDANQLAPLVAFFHLAVDQALRHLPLACFPPSTTSCEPLSKMGREGIEVQIQAITGEERQTARGQDLSQGVDDRMRCVLRAGAKMEHGKNLREGINGQPEPEHLLELRSLVRSSSNWRCGSWMARNSAHARSARARQRESARW